MKLLVEVWSDLGLSLTHPDLRLIASLANHRYHHQDTATVSSFSMNPTDEMYSWSSVYARTHSPTANLPQCIAISGGGQEEVREADSQILPEPGAISKPLDEEAGCGPTRMALTLYLHKSAGSDNGSLLSNDRKRQLHLSSKTSDDVYNWWCNESLLE
ncbi:hypothetical protein J6590_052181 [Homalodisca vitripennis]|nr:hypothetical protein J6590_052181 [Homalodisca vitripennis]